MLNLTKPQKLIYDMEKFVGGAIAVICGSMLINGKKDLAELKQAVNEIYRLNDALRIRISEENGEVSQTIVEYRERDIEVLHFNNKAELDSYAEDYAKIPIDFYGNLCEFQIVILPEQYGLLVKLHHIIGDAWTVSLMGTQFNAILSGKNPEAYSYTDYIEKENVYVQSKRYEKDTEYFLEQFKRCDEVTYLNEKHSDTLNTSRKTFVIDYEKTKQLNEYAQQNGTSAFMLFTAALSTYINRIKMNIEKFYIGTAVLNRNGTKDKNTVGMFVNTVPMLIELNNTKSFADNLSNIAGVAFSVFRHQKYNYGDVLATVRKEYGFTEKLYDVMISYQNASITGAGIETTWYCSGMQSESLQMHIDDRDNEGIFRIHYDYQNDKFTEYNIDLLHQHICNLLFDAIQNDAKKLYELKLLTSDEKQKLLYEFNDTAVDYPRDKCVHMLFEEQVEKTPNKTAVIACDRTLTYADLNEEANKIAHSLIGEGVGVGDIVAFALKRKSYLISVIFGILKSGAVYLPIDLDYPQERIDYILSDSGVKFYITENNIKELLSNIDGSNPNINMSSDALCYCIYTSGSTGKPKGTLLKHSGIVNLVTNLDIYNDLSKCERFGFMTTITFDVATQEIFTALLNGFVGILMPERKESSSDTIIKGIIEHKVDVIYATPTYFDSLTATEDNTNRLLSSVKVVCLAGEKFSLNKNVLALKDNYNLSFENQYGPVELHVIATATALCDNDFGSIGKPVGNDKAYIIDQYMQLAPIGVTGELCITGEGVGVGYLNLPELTAEKFIDNPFGEGKLYKTGDLAYWREDGNIVYVGRNDFQVKIRGLRIELSEIEKAICDIDGISQAVVDVRKNSEGRQLICAFYMGVEVGVKEICNHIGKRLPKYMLPHICVRLEEMPLTSSGKVNRKTLPEVDLYVIDTAVEYVAPETEKEKILSSAIGAILGLDKVGIMDNFFDIGGDSLKAIELSSKLEKQGYRIDIRTIFNCETVKEITEKVTVVEGVEESFDYTGDVPATDAQMRVYTAQSMHSNSTTYNVPYVFKVGDVNIERLQTAINKLIGRHEILRTHFENKDGRIIQVINDIAECKVEKLDTGDMTAFVCPFDLSRAPLLRIGVYGNIVMIDMHHIITDGSSMPIFLNELNELYMGRSLKNMPIQYKQFALQNEEYSESEKYWLSVYNDELPVLEINTDFHRGQKQSFNGRVIFDSLNIELHNRIITYCKEQNVTPYVFYMSGFNILLSKFSGNEDIIVGMPISGRGAKYLDTIGMFVNTIVLRNKPVGTKTVTEFLREVKDNSIDAINYQNYPYGELVKKLDTHTPERNPLFDVMFAYQSEQMTDVVFGDRKAELLPITVTTSKYDFTFNVMPRESDVVIMAEYCTDLYKESTMRRFVNAYKQILEQLINNGNTQLKNISVITKTEKQKLLFDFNDTVMDYPKGKCVHQLFEEQVEKTTDSIALKFGEKAFTYAELNGLANGLAVVLKSHGVEHGDVVAIISKRSYHIVVAMLSIFKCGAAYLPIDYNYPKDRIDMIANDAGCKVILTYGVNYDNENIIEIPEYITPFNENLCCDVNPEDICGIIYTSGSTGIPKGTLLQHKGLVNYTYANDALYEGGSCNIGFAIYTFDAFFLDIIAPMLRGNIAVMATEEEQFNQIAFENLIKKYPNCNLFITPAKFKQFFDNRRDNNFYHKVHNICIGGEVFPQEFVGMFSANTNVFNVYGPTECSMWVLQCPVVNTDVTLGKPMGNVQVYILDKNNKIIPIGVTGELCIAGDCVGDGYLNLPELTAEKYIDNPFGDGKLYKTGDLAYWREDGNIVYVGRNDFQVKIRGLRIELGEIENAILCIAGISQVVVVVRKNSGGRQLICAFYTGTEIDAKEIRNCIGKKLPKYMLPHICVHLEKMPMTTSGKINRKVLPEVNLENITNDVEYVVPESTQQKELCKLIESVLGTTPVGITDDFFDLGGDSLKAIEFVSKAHNEGIYFNLQNVFDYPTLKALCEYIENGDRQGASFADVDFIEVNKLLEKNMPQHIVTPKKIEVGNILLAGATGYLGIHILSDYLENDNGTAYCVVRGEDKEGSIKRLKELLRFYFGDKYTDMHRIEVICADLQKDKFGLLDSEYTELLSKVDTVINSAASVKHYGSYKYFYEVNVETTKRLIEFCKEANAKLIHTSTLSVSGNTFGDAFDGYVSENEKHFYESSLYIGQPLDNVYGRSKFEAEKAVLDAMCDGLQANIMRMGNLTNRLSDGIFQKNHESNAFLQRVKGVLELGIFPDYLMNLYAEFTPVDEAANAVMTITRNFSTEQTVFHINSIKVVYFDKLLKIFNELGFELKTVSGAEFTDALRATAKQSGMEHIFETFINDMDEDDKLTYDSNIHIENDFTVQYLKMLGFEWSDIGIGYMRKYVEYFKKIGYMR